MACYYPLQAFQMADGSIRFSQRGDCVRSLQLPCGQCTGCRLERSRQWAMRCVHEASLFKSNCFVTLTYRPEDIPFRGSLDYSHFQKFFKRLRKRVAPLRPRFYMCGEYGSEEGRPHFHACVFGYDFPDKVYWKTCGSESKLFRSQILEELWPYGFSSVGDLTFESAAYVARYCLKKVTGKEAEAHYRRMDVETGELYSITPEFTRMSLKPGIGANWYRKFRTDVFPNDYVIVNGKKVKPPRYYDQLFGKDAPFEFDALAFDRELLARDRADDNTAERLAVKDIVAKAGLAFFRRDL